MYLPRASHPPSDGDSSGTFSKTGRRPVAGAEASVSSKSGAIDRPTSGYGGVLYGQTRLKISPTTPWCPICTAAAISDRGR